jgi:hypothetical protein
MTISLSCHCGLDPQSRKSWMPDQVRHDNHRVKPGMTASW